MLHSRIEFCAGKAFAFYFLSTANVSVNEHIRDAQLYGCEGYVQCPRIRNIRHICDKICSEKYYFESSILNSYFCCTLHVLILVLNPSPGYYFSMFTMKEKYRHKKNTV
ncbi:hypothetical protein S83_067515 [Arachis hypogaea]